MKEVWNIFGHQLHTPLLKCKWFKIRSYVLEHCCTLPFWLLTVRLHLRFFFLLQVNLNFVTYVEFTGIILKQ